MKKDILVTLAPILFVMFSLHGCATAFHSAMPVTTTVTPKKVIAQDTVRAIGHPINSGEKIGGLVLIGDQYTYWITDGDKKIELMASQLNPKYIKMENVTTLTVKENGFFGRISFDYDNDDNEYSTSEAVALSKMCDKARAPGKWFGFGQHIYYSCGINVSGLLYYGQSSSLLEIKDLSKGRSVKLISVEEPITTVDSHKVAHKIVTLPFAIAFDLVTLPLQVILLYGTRNQ